MNLRPAIVALSAAAASVLAQRSAHAQHTTPEALVHVEASTNSVFLQRHGETENTVTTARGTIVSTAPNQPPIDAVSLTVSSTDFWAPACAAPCGVRLPRSEMYRAYNGVPSAPFRLPVGEVTLRLHPGDLGLLLTGVFALSIGGLSVIVGSTFGIVAASDAEFAARPATLPFVITSVSVGAVLTALGAWGTYGGMTHVDDLTHRRRLARSPALSVDLNGVHF